MRFLLVAILYAVSAIAAETTYPHWDGSESIEQYAKRANLPPTKTLDLGNSVKLELVLIPAGKFVMGTPEPPPVDEEGFLEKIQVGQMALALSSGVLLVMLAFVVIRAIQTKHRPQVSLARLMVLAVIAGAGLLGGLHWHYSERALAAAWIEYVDAMVRFNNSDDWEKPAHDVTLTKPFYLGKYEVTQEQYQQVMGNNSSRFKGRDLPVEMVSWEDAQAFCQKVSEKTGSDTRLPTDAEWERACRAGTKTMYYTGDAETDLDRVGWYEKNSKNTTHPVGQKTSNAWGVYDMHGNVWEWCTDRYGDYGADAVVDPQGPAQGAYRILRGGSWCMPPSHCRSANRHWYYPKERINHYYGFRVVVVVVVVP